MSADICYLRKSVDNQFFLSDEYSENFAPIGNDPTVLAAAYPFRKFVLINDDTDYGARNIIPRKDILLACGVDKELTVPCAQCETRFEYSKSQCAECGTANDRQEICLHVLGHDYKKAVAQERMDNFFSRGASLPSTGFGKTNINYSDSRVQYDPLLRLLSRGFERVGV